MKPLLVVFIPLVLLGCGEEMTPAKEESFQEKTVITHLADTVIPYVKDTTPFYPSFKVQDSSWHVRLDIQEGFLLNFAISYKNRQQLVVDVEHEAPSSGGVDHPEPHYINDTVFKIPNVGGSPLGYYEMYIHKNGSYRFNQIILVDTTANK